jgi:hypothetical protein
MKTCTALGITPSRRLVGRLANAKPSRSGQAPRATPDRHGGQPDHCKNNQRRFAATTAHITGIRTVPAQDAYLARIFMLSERSACRELHGLPSASIHSVSKAGQLLAGRAVEGDGWNNAKTDLLLNPP